jgi:antitoxin component YwqK of YwqJK toxin-antitoxin module
MKDLKYIFLFLSILLIALSCKSPIKKILTFSSITYNDSPNNFRYEDFPNEDSESGEFYSEQFVEGGLRMGKIDNGFKEGKWLSGDVDFDSLGNVYAKGKIWREEYFKRGLRDSIYRIFNNNTDSIIYETIFRNGSGLLKDFHSNGQLYYEIETKDGYFTDTLRLYYKYGIIIEKLFYDKDSLI